MVLRENFRVALTVAVLNYLQVRTADIHNAYIQAPVAENIWTVLGPEFGLYDGKPEVVVRSLYRLKSAGDSFRNHLAY